MMSDNMQQLVESLKSAGRRAVKWKQIKEVWQHCKQWRQFDGLKETCKAEHRPL